MTVAIGIDVGGTKITGALITEDGRISHECAIATPRSPHGADPGASATAGLISRLEQSARLAGLDVAAVGIGVPEYVSPSGRITSREVLGWGDETNLTDDGMAVVLDSDVRCAVRAENQLGHGREHSSFLFVSVGTGISSTLVVENRIWAGHRGEALALGELRVDPVDTIRLDAPLTVEQQASGRAIELALGDDSIPRAEPAQISLRGGNVVASAIATAVHLTDPAAVVLGGGLGTSNGPFTTSLSRRFDQLLSNRPAPPPLLQSLLGPAAGVIGAGLAAHGL